MFKPYRLFSLFIQKFVNTYLLCGNKGTCTRYVYPYFLLPFFLLLIFLATIHSLTAQVAIDPNAIPEDAVVTPTPTPTPDPSATPVVSVVGDTDISSLKFNGALALPWQGIGYMDANGCRQDLGDVSANDKLGLGAINMQNEGGTYGDPFAGLGSGPGDLGDDDCKGGGSSPPVGGGNTGIGGNTGGSGGDSDFGASNYGSGYGGGGTATNNNVGRASRHNSSSLGGQVYYYTGEFSNDTGDLTLSGRSLQLPLKRTFGSIGEWLGGGPFGKKSIETNLQGSFGRNVWNTTDVDHCNDHTFDDACNVNSCPSEECGQDDWKLNMSRKEQYFVRLGDGTVMDWSVGRKSPIEKEDGTRKPLKRCELVFSANQYMTFIKEGNSFYVREKNGRIYAFENKSANYFYRRVNPYWGPRHGEQLADGTSNGPKSRRGKYSSIGDKNLLTQSCDSSGSCLSYNWQQLNNGLDYQGNMTVLEQVQSVASDFGSITLNYNNFTGKKNQIFWPDIEQRVSSVTRSDGRTVSYNYYNSEEVPDWHNPGSYRTKQAMLKSALKENGLEEHYNYIDPSDMRWSPSNSEETSAKSWALTGSGVGPVGSDRTLFEVDFLAPYDLRIIQKWHRSRGENVIHPGWGENSHNIQEDVPHKYFRYWPGRDSYVERKLDCDAKFHNKGSKWLTTYEAINRDGEDLPRSCSKGYPATRVKDESGLEHHYRYDPRGCMAMDEVILDQSLYGEGHPLHGVERLRTEYKYFDWGDKIWSLPDGYVEDDWDYDNEQNADEISRNCLPIRVVLSKVYQWGHSSGSNLHCCLPSTNDAGAEEQIGEACGRSNGAGTYQNSEEAGGMNSNVGTGPKDGNQGCGGFSVEDRSEIIKVTIFKYQVEEDYKATAEFPKGKRSGMRMAASWDTNGDGQIDDCSGARKDASGNYLGWNDDWWWVNNPFNDNDRVAVIELHDEVIKQYNGAQEYSGNAPSHLRKCLLNGQNDTTCRDDGTAAEIENDPRNLKTTISYDPIYGRQRLLCDASGVCLRHYFDYEECNANGVDSYLASKGNLFANGKIADYVTAWSLTPLDGNGQATSPLLPDPLGGGTILRGNDLNGDGIAGGNCHWKGLIVKSEYPVDQDGNPLPVANPNDPFGTKYDSEIAGHYNKVFTEIMQYNQFGSLIRKEKADGSVVEFAYYPLSSPFGVSGSDSAAGNGGKLAKTITNPGGAADQQLIEKFKYYASGNISDKTDVRGMITHFTYDAEDRLIKEEVCYGVDSAYASDISCTANDKITKELRYNPQGLLSQQIISLNSRDENIAQLGESLAQKFYYNDQGKIVKQTLLYGPTANRTEIVLKESQWLETGVDKPVRVDSYRDDNSSNALVARTVYDYALNVIESYQQVPSAGDAPTENDKVKKVTNLYDAENRLVRTEDQLHNLVAGDDSNRGDRTEISYADLEGSSDPLGEGKILHLITTTDSMGNCSRSWLNKQELELLKRRYKGCPGNADSQIMAQQQFFYDGNKRLAKEEVAIFSGSKTAAQLSGADKAVKKYWYDEAGRVILEEIDNCFNGEAKSSKCIQQLRTKYNDLGLVAEVIDGENNKTLNSYQYGLLSKVTLVEQEPDPENQGQTIAVNYYSHFAYDALGRKISQTAAEVADLDQCGGTGNKICNTTSFTFNTRDKMVSSEDALGNRTRYVYDQFGNNIKTIRELYTMGMGNDYGYGTLLNDPQHDGTCANAPAKGDSCIVTEQSYFYNGALDWVKDDNGVLMRNVYDGFGRLLKEKYACDNMTCAKPQRQVVYDEYDKDGNLRRFHDRNNNEITLVYDSLQHIRKKTVSSKASCSGASCGAHDWSVSGSGQQTFDFDELGNLTKQTDDNGIEEDVEVTYSFDSVGRALTETLKIGDFNQTVDASFRPFGDFSELEYAYSGGNFLLSANRDSQRRITEMCLNQSFENCNSAKAFASYDYLGSKRFKKRVSGNMKMSAGYDVLGRRTMHKLYAGEDANSNDCYASFAEEDLYKKNCFVFDPVGNRAAKIVESGPRLSRESQAEVYAYDSAYRLIKFKQGVEIASVAAYKNQSLNDKLDSLNFIPGLAHDTEYILDGEGNRQSMQRDSDNPVSYQVNDLNEYTKIAEAPNQGYDWSGNLLSFNETERGFNFEYDAFNRLIAVYAYQGQAEGSRDEPRGDLIAKYLYDAANRRVAKCQAFNQSSPATCMLGEADYYVYKGDILLAEMNSSRQTELRYVPGRVVQEVVAIEGTRTSGNRHYLHMDSLGSLILTTDETGNPEDEYEYDAYGRVLDESGVPIDRYQPQSSISKSPILFAGSYYDQETGLYYNRARYYDPIHGRFISLDPAQADGRNWYQYALSNPTNIIDPTGLAFSKNNNNNNMDQYNAIDDNDPLGISSFIGDQDQAANDPVENAVPQEPPPDPVPVDPLPQDNQDQLGQTSDALGEVEGASTEGNKSVDNLHNSESNNNKGEKESPGNKFSREFKKTIKAVGKAVGKTIKAVGKAVGKVAKKTEFTITIPGATMPGGDPSSKANDGTGLPSKEPLSSYILANQIGGMGEEKPNIDTATAGTGRGRDDPRGDGGRPGFEGRSGSEGRNTNPGASTNTDVGEQIKAKDPLILRPDTFMVGMKIPVTTLFKKSYDKGSGLKFSLVFQYEDIKY